MQLWFTPNFFFGAKIVYQDLYLATQFYTFEDKVI